MKSQRVFRVSIAAALIGVASLTVGGLLAGSVPASSFAAAPAMLVQWTWTGNGGDDRWVSDCNWQPPGICTDAGFPDGTDDNATFPTNGASAWAVDLVDEEIGDLTIKESVNFGAASGTPTLDVKKLSIVGSGEQITITIGEGADITIAP